MGNREHEHPEEIMGRAASVLAARFIQSWDMYPRQLDDGRYITVHEPLEVSHLWHHLEGAITLGAYILDANSQGRFIVLDADDDASWERLKNAAHHLEQQNCPNYLEASRRGGHLWLFTHQMYSGEQLRGFGKGIMGRYRLEGIELYPKQDQLKSGPGSLIRLPCGVHRKTGKRYSFYTLQGRPLAPSLHQQMEILRSPRKVSESAFHFFVECGSVQRPEPDFSAISRPQNAQIDTSHDLTPAERIKAAVSVRTFVEQYVTLTPRGQGLCPFHEDHKASFSVNEAENYWHCFACDMGGSIIDFWMQYRKCEFKPALRELADLLL